MRPVGSGSTLSQPSAFESTVIPTSARAIPTAPARGRAAIAVLATLLAAATQAAVAQQTTDTVALEVGRALERPMATGGAAHHYRIHLAAGQQLRAVVQQRGVDVVVAVYGPDGRRLLEVDSPNGDQGPEPVRLVAPTTGSYRLEIGPYPEAAGDGRYEVRVESVLSEAEVAAELAADRARHDSATAWLARSAVRLRTPEAGRGFDDMAPIGAMVGRARLVSLGEATHGTREFFQLKHRMLEYLVAEHGFTVFGIEATMPEGFDVNHYVLTGEGDPAKALAGLYFWTWDTEEVLDMIRWMRQWNADPRHRRKVKFYGFDMQSAPLAVRRTVEYLRSVEPAEAARAESTLALVVNPFTDGEFEALPADERRAMLASARAVLARFDEQRAAWGRRTGAAAWAVARQHARVLVQNLSMRLAPDGGFAVRDRSMAENARWILEYEGPDARMVIWAHNGHVASDSTGAAVAMGQHLRRMLGDSMVVFGFAFGRGGFQAMEMPFPSRRGLIVFDVPPLPDSTLDGTLARAGLRLAAVDLRRLPAGPVAAWFAERHGTRRIGAGFGDAFAANFVSPEVTAHQYDALLYVDSTTAARPNRAGGRPPSNPLPAPVNLDFEDVDAEGRPIGWSFNAARLRTFDFGVSVTAERPAAGLRCVEVRRDPVRHYGELFGGPSQLLDATPYRGRRVRVRAMARADLVGRGSEARLWAQAARPLVSILQPPERRASAVVTLGEWRPYEIVVEVPADATTLTIGFALVGDGRAWVDAVSLETLP